MASDDISGDERSFLENLYWWGVATLFGCPHDTDPGQCDIALVGVPHSSGNGATERDQHLGPRAVRNISGQFSPRPRRLPVLAVGGMPHPRPGRRAAAAGDGQRRVGAAYRGVLQGPGQRRRAPGLGRRRSFHYRPDRKGDRRRRRQIERRAKGRAASHRRPHRLLRPPPRTGSARCARQPIGPAISSPRGISIRRKACSSASAATPTPSIGRDRANGWDTG